MFAIKLNVYLSILNHSVPGTGRITVPGIGIIIVLIFLLGNNLPTKRGQQNRYR
jgi:hypothetical protein